jgi:hypothetical protein
MPGKSRDMTSSIAWPPYRDMPGVEVGAYADFGRLRDYIVRKLEGGKFGSRFPDLMVHSDCDGEWSAEQGLLLRRDITDIIDSRKQRPSVPFSSGWQQSPSRQFYCHKMRLSPS